VTVGGETETLDSPSGHDVDEQMIVDLRRMLKGAGISGASTSGASTGDRRA